MEKLDSTAADRRKIAAFIRVDLHCNVFSMSAHNRSGSVLITSHQFQIKPCFISVMKCQFSR